MQYSIMRTFTKNQFYKIDFDEPIIVRNTLQCNITIYYIYYKNIISINNMFLIIFKKQL